MKTSEIKGMDKMLKIYLRHESYFESRSQVLRQKFTAAHTHFSDGALMIAYKEKSTK